MLDQFSDDKVSTVFSEKQQNRKTKNFPDFSLMISTRQPVRREITPSCERRAWPQPVIYAKWIDLFQKLAHSLRSCKLCGLQLLNLLYLCASSFKNSLIY